MNFAVRFIYRSSSPWHHFPAKQPYCVTPLTQQCVSFANMCMYHCRGTMKTLCCWNTVWGSQADNISSMTVPFFLSRKSTLNDNRNNSKTKNNICFGINNN